MEQLSSPHTHVSINKILMTEVKEGQPTTVHWDLLIKKTSSVKSMCKEEYYQPMQFLVFEQVTVCTVLARTVNISYCGSWEPQPAWELQYCPSMQTHHTPCRLTAPCKLMNTSRLVILPCIIHRPHLSFPTLLTPWKQTQHYLSTFIWSKTTLKKWSATDSHSSDTSRKTN